MTELFRQLQAALWLAADTVDIWRDAALMLLAGVVIACLWLAAETSRS